MVQLVPYQQRETLRPVSGAMQRAASDTGAEMVGRSVQRLGATMGQAAQELERQNIMRDEAAVMEQDAALSQWEQENLTGFLNQQGKNALDQESGFLESWKKRQGEALAAATTERQRALLRRQLQRRDQAVASRVNAHVVRQTEVYHEGARVARQALTVSEIALMDDGPDRLALQMGLEASIRNEGDRQGWAPERTQAEIVEARNGYHLQTVNRLLAGDDPSLAESYLDRWGGQMDTATRTQAQRVVQEQSRAFSANQFANSDELTAFITGGAVSAETMAEGPAAVNDALWEAQKQQESGNRQFTRSGRLITSSAGAFGVAQLMPDTARWIAQQMGDPSLAARSRTDPAVNERMGRWYMDQQLAKYGSPVVALAAYNAGPGRADAWLRRFGDPRTGAITEAEWAARIPFDETRKYVANIMGAYERAGGQPGAMRSGVSRRGAVASPEEVRSFARAEAAKRGLGWREAEAFEDAAVGRLAEINADTRAREQAAWDAVQDYLPGGPTPVLSATAIPARVVDELSPQQRNALNLTLQREAEALARGQEVETNAAEWTRLYRLRHENPRAFLQVEPSTYINSLSPSDYQEVVKWREGAAKAVNGASADEADTVDYNRVRRATASTWVAAGYETAGDDAENRAEFDRYVIRAAEAYRQRHGKGMTDDELRGLAAQGLRQVRNGRRAFESPGAATVIPENDEAAIRRVYAQRGVSLTDQDVEGIYRAWLQSGRLSPPVD